MSVQLLLSYSFPFRMHIWRENGIWMLDTGIAVIPHETWILAADHARFIHRIRTDVNA